MSYLYLKTSVYLRCTSALTPLLSHLGIYTALLAVVTQAVPRVTSE